MKKGIRILILEDDATDAESLRRELQRGQVSHELLASLRTVQGTPE